jgi:hypothetical protein
MKSKIPDPDTSPAINILGFVMIHGLIKKMKCGMYKRPSVLSLISMQLPIFRWSVGTVIYQLLGLDRLDRGCAMAAKRDYSNRSSEKFWGSSFGCLVLKNSKGTLLNTSLCL